MPKIVIFYNRSIIVHNAFFFNPITFISPRCYCYEVKINIKIGIRQQPGVRRVSLEMLRCRIIAVDINRAETEIWIELRQH